MKRRRASFQLGLAVLIFALCAAAGAQTTPMLRAPSLKSPRHQTVLRNYPRVVQFEWGPVSGRGEVQYFLEIQTYYPSGTGGVGVWRSKTLGPIQGTRCEYVHIGDQRAQWRVWAVDASGNTSQKSVWNAFTFQTGTGELKLVVPAATPSPTPAVEEEPGPKESEPVEPEPLESVRVHRPAPASEPAAPETSALGTAPPEPGQGPEEFSPAVPGGPAPELSEGSALAAELKGGAGGLGIAPEAASTGGGATPLPAVALVSPSDGAALSSYPREVKLSWNPISGSGGATYTVEVQTMFPLGGSSEGASRSQFYRGVSGASVTHAHAGDYKGRWRVWAVDAGGNAGSPSSWRTFSFNSSGNSKRQEDLRPSSRPASEAPLEASPATVVVPPVVSPAVSAPRSGAASGRPGRPAAAPTPRITPRPAPSETALPGAEAAGPESKAPGEDSGVETPTPISPPDGAILDDDEPYVICKWSETSGARYTMEMQTLDPQTNQWVSKVWENLTAPTKTPATEAPRRGRWRVKAVMRAGESGWSAWRRFGYHTEGAATDAPDVAPSSARARPAVESDKKAPPAPTLSSPGPNVVVESPTRGVTLEWNPVEDESGATYTCVVEVEEPTAAAAGPGSWQAHAFSGLVEPRLVYQHPGPGRARWWVLAVDGAGNSSTPSELRQILFQPSEAPAVSASSGPEALAPGGEANVPSGPLALSWRPIADESAQYRIEVQVLAGSDKGGGLWRTVAGETVRGASCVFSAEPGQKYRWRVGAAGGDRGEAFSSWQRFQSGE